MATAIDSNADVFPAEHQITISELPKKDESEDWNLMVDQKLIKWGKNPELLTDEECEPPTPKALSIAALLATKLGDLGSLAPTRVVSVGDGGVAFERRDGGLLEVIEIMDTGSVEMLLFKESELVKRVELAL